MFYICSLDSNYIIASFVSAVLSAHTFDGTIASSIVFPLKQIHTSHGITDLSSIRNDGKLTCEKPGLYLISASVSLSENSNRYYYVYKSNGAIARAFRHPQ